MKKILATILALVMAIGVTTMAWAAETEVSDATALNNAINADGVNVVDVKLGADISADITIPTGKTVTIDLNGKKLTNVSGDTITVQNGATLIINGSGTVDNVTNAKAAIYNNGTVKLNGGKYTRSAEAANTTESGGGNSYYNILNHGDMTINAGVEVTSTGHFSSLVANGYYNYSSRDPRSGYVEGTGEANPTLTINGGTFSGGINTIKNDDGATLTINNGNFSNITQAVVQNNNVALIKGGTFDGTGHHAVENRHYDGGVNAGEITVENGTFKGEVYVTDGATTKISGGTFDVDVSQYLENGKQQNADGSVGNIPRYYYNSTTTTTDTKKADGTKGSPKTFDAGVGIYAVSALLSVTGMAYVGKKKF